MFPYRVLTSGTLMNSDRWSRRRLAVRSFCRRSRSAFDRTSRAEPTSRFHTIRVWSLERALNGGYARAGRIEPSGIDRPSSLLVNGDLAFNLHDVGRD